MSLLQQAINMGWYAGTRLFGRRSNKAGSAHPRDPVIAAWFGGTSTASGATVTPDSALAVATVYACVRFISESVAMLPLNVNKRLDPRGKERDPKHPLYRILKHRPNRWQSPFEFKRMLTGHAVLRGNGYAEIIGTDTRAVAELWPLHPDLVTPYRDPASGDIAYKYQPQVGPQRIILQAEMLHLRGPSFDGIAGLNPIRLHREAIGLALAGQEAAARQFGNGAQPAGAIKISAALDDEAAGLLVNSWERRHRGPANKERIAVLDGGMEWEQIGMSNEDAQFLQTRKYSRSEIAAIFRVKPHKIGDMEKATFSNIAQENLSSLNDTLMPWIILWEQACERDLLVGAYQETHSVDFLVNALLRGEPESRGIYYSKLSQLGALSPNDIRELEDMNPIGPEGDVYVSPANMTPLALLQAMVDEAVNNRMAEERENGKEDGTPHVHAR